MGNSVFIILLEMLPIAKGRPRLGKHGTYTPQKTKNFENTAKRLMKSQFYMQPLEGPLQVDLQFIFPKPTKPKHKTWHIVRPDCDNLIKSVTDAGNEILWLDDSQICRLGAQKKYCENGTTPRIILTITTLDGA